MCKSNKKSPFSKEEKIIPPKFDFSPRRPLTNGPNGSMIKAIREQEKGFNRMKRFGLFAGEYFAFYFTFYQTKSKVDLPCEREKSSCL